VPTHVPDLSAVLCPPYDVIGGEERIELLQRHPYNAVRLELPSAPEGMPDVQGTGGAHDDARYRQAARELASWRSQGVLAKDALPSIYVHEMRYAGGPASGPTVARGSTVARGVMLRLRLEPLGPGSGVRPHERTMSAPKEDRYQLLRATGTNLSPVVLIHERLATAAALDALTSGPPDAETSDSTGIQHRLWVVPAGAGDAASRVSAASATASELLGVIGGGPLTMADGHHRYETALRYREERGQRRACEGDPAYDYVLALVYAVDAAPAALATHRVVHGLGSAQGAGFLAAAEGLFHVDRLADAEQLGDRLAGSAVQSGTGRFGYAGPDGVALLTVRRKRFAPLLDADLPEAARWLDTSLLAVALRHLAAIGPEDLSGGGRVTYVKDASAALAMTSDQQSTAFLLDPTPVASVLRVAEAGGVMPQKSTYFYPKAPTGLLFNPLEQ